MVVGPHLRISIPVRGRETTRTDSCGREELYAPGQGQLILQTGAEDPGQCAEGRNRTLGIPGRGLRPGYFCSCRQVQVPRLNAWDFGFQAQRWFGDPRRLARSLAPGTGQKTGGFAVFTRFPARRRETTL